MLAYKIDRLTRSVKDFHLLMDIFDKYNVKFVSITQSLDTQHPMGRLLRNILLDFAQFEREMTADRTRDKMHQRAQKGMWNGGTIAYGYRSDNKKLVKDEIEAPRVQFVFQWFSKDPSIARLRDELRRRGWLRYIHQATISPCLRRASCFRGRNHLSRLISWADWSALGDAQVTHKMHTDARWCSYLLVSWTKKTSVISAFP